MNSYKKNIALFTFLLVSLIAARAFASFIIPAAPKAYVNDYVGLLDSNTKQKLEQTLKTFEEETSSQVLVAIFPSLEGENLEDLSIRLAEKWKAGQKDKDNGVIFLVFKDDRKLRIEVGYGLEAVLTDALSKSIIQNEIVPYFKQGDYSSGILSGVAAILKATRGEYKAKKSQRNEGIDLDSLWLILFLFLFIFLPQFQKNRGRRDGVTFGSGWGGGGSSGGGGFSGGGGGGFGGGGSSGSW